MFEACTIMFYSALATVLVRTVPALRLVIATITGCTYGIAYSSTHRTQVIHGLRLSGSVTRAMSNGSTHSWLTVASKNRSLIFSDRKHQKRRLRMNRQYAGIVRRLVVKVP